MKTVKMKLFRLIFVSAASNQEIDMTVFYSVRRDGTFEFCFTRLLGNIVIPDVDVSYWVVPGTLED